jgi:hypothetical protein
MADLHCRVELSKTKGLVLTVEDEQGKITQTVTLDGAQIQIKCQGQEDTSEITQKPDGITIKCKNLTLEAETLSVKSTKDSTYKSDQKITIQSAQDLTAKSDAKIAATATGDMTLEGNKLTATAQTDAKVGGMNVNLEGTAKAVLKGAQVEVSASTGNLDAKGMMVKVEATATLDLNGQMTTLKGQMVNVSGPMVKLGP